MSQNVRCYCDRAENPARRNRRTEYATGRVFAEGVIGSQSVPVFDSAEYQPEDLPVTNARLDPLRIELLQPHGLFSAWDNAARRAVVCPGLPRDSIRLPVVSRDLFSVYQWNLCSNPGFRKKFRSSKDA